MKLVLKLTIGIILTLIIAMLTTWYIKKPQKPEVFEIQSQKSISTSDIEVFKNIPVEVLKPQIPSKPPIKIQPPSESSLEVSTETTSSEETGENIEIIIKAKEFTFTPKEITTKADVPNIIVFKNEEKIPLDFKISNENWSVKSDLIPPGSEIRLEVKFPGPGEYEFYSTVPLAQEKNMKGKIIVK